MLNERFALFYEEKRPFFLEGIDYFSTPVNAVYTRTVVAPDWGGKISGKIGKNAHGQDIAFVHPKSFLGSLLEVEQTPPPEKK